MAKKRKNYLKLFVDFCRKNGIWYAVCGNGDIDSATDTEIMDDLDLSGHPLGSKKAYDEIVKEVLDGRIGTGIGTQF